MTEPSLRQRLFPEILTGRIVDKYTKYGSAMEQFVTHYTITQLDGNVWRVKIEGCQALKLKDMVQICFLTENPCIGSNSRMQGVTPQRRLYNDIIGYRLLGHG